MQEQMLQLTAKTQAEINKQSAASNKTPLLGGPAPYGPGIPPEVPFAVIQLPLLPARVLRPAYAWSEGKKKGCPKAAPIKRHTELVSVSILICVSYHAEASTIICISWSIVKSVINLTLSTRIIK